jgi:hypothetical protein
MLEIAQEWMERKNEYYRKYLETITPANALPGVGRFLDEAKDAGIAGESAPPAERPMFWRGCNCWRFRRYRRWIRVVNTKPAPICLSGRHG